MSRKIIHCHQNQSQTLKNYDSDTMLEFYDERNKIEVKNNVSFISNIRMPINRLTIDKSKLK